MSFGENLQKLRKSQGMSQEQLADRLEVSRQAVSKWESDQGYPEISKIIQIGDMFDISLDDLLRDGRSPSPGGGIRLQDIWNALRGLYKELSRGRRGALWFITVCGGALILIGIYHMLYRAGLDIGAFVYHITH